jgi:hypothetical protein
MACCGANRAVGRGSAAASTSRVAPMSVTLRWRRRVTAVVDGPVTRTRYPVSAEAPVITVDTRDADGLLRTGFFERVG